ncbi:MAG TPA: sugar ABC transporter ATP-binding protein [Anaerolineae bacterium]|nr:sugar ABC transporter ATP-binding protein [Anaerolineae bacterium]
MSNNSFLKMEGITKNYPGVQALKAVNFEVARGEIHALVGENGAGKSTLMKILTGAQLPDAGQITFQQQPVKIDSPAVAQNLGISMIHQELSLIPYLTVGQNIFLGREPGGTLPGFVAWSTLYAQAQQLLDRLNVSVEARAEVQGLSIAQQQMVEVAKALSLKARLIAMDEPTSALSERETDILFEVMRSLKAQGVSIIFISHRLEEVFQIADRVTVLRDGQFIGTVPVSELDEGRVVEMMVGRQLAETIYQRDTQFDSAAQPVILAVRDLSEGQELRGVNLTLHQGEILGIAGLVGAGRTALAETLFGLRPATRGSIELAGQPVKLHTPSQAIRLGLGFVPEDRKLQGLFMNMAVRENIIVSDLADVTRWGWLSFSQANRLAGEFVKKLGIRTPGLLQTVRNLSGGNQQKVIIARWLTLKPRILILDEPTRGIDVGAKAEIHALMHQLAESGVGVLMISSELPEVLGISDRIVVMHEGQVVKEFSRAEATQAEIMHAATGGKGNNAARSAS